MVQERATTEGCEQEISNLMGQMQEMEARAPAPTISLPNLAVHCAEPEGGGLPAVRTTLGQCVPNGVEVFRKCRGPALVMPPRVIWAFLQVCSSSACYGFGSGASKIVRVMSAAGQTLAKPETCHKLMQHLSRQSGNRMWSWDWDELSD